jgi:hypothetical protein
VAPKWGWLLVTLVALAVSGLVPGSQPRLQADGGAIVTTAVRAPSGSECAAVACNRGTPSPSAPLPGITLAGTIAAGSVVVLALCPRRRRRRVATSLPTGSPSPLFRPPQLGLSA